MGIDRLVEIALGNAGFAVALALVAWVASRFVRRPAVVHALWMVVLLRLLAPPVFELALLPPKPATPHTAAAAPVGAEPAVAAPAGAPQPNLGAREAGLLAWLAGALALLAIGGVRTVRLVRAVRSATDPSPALTERLAVVARAMGAHPPRVRVVGPITPPMVWSAFGRPQLILPQVLVDHLSTAELDALLAHELAHLRRRDHWVRYLELAAVALFWWNPAAWWASRRLRQAEEECCDAMVARSLPGTARAYADSLIKTLRYLAGFDSFVPAVATGASHFENIERRIRGIMSDKNVRTVSSPLRAALVVLALGVLVITPTLTARMAAVPAGHSQSADVAFSGDPITVHLQNANLEKVLQTFATLTGLNVVIDPAVTVGRLNAPITLAFEDAPWDQMLDEVIRQAGLAWTLEGSLLWVHMPGEPPVGDREFTGESITLDLQEADLLDVLETLERVTGMYVEVDDDVSGSVTLHVQDMPWDQVLDLILRTNGLTAEIVDGVVRVHRAPGSGAKLLRQKLPPQAASTVDERNGAPVYRFVHGSGISEPVRVDCPAPEYTDEARDAGIEGQVVLKAVLDTEGRTASVELVSGLPLGLSDSAIEAVRAWRFEPARLDGEPVAVEYIVAADFKLE